MWDIDLYVIIYALLFLEELAMEIDTIGKLLKEIGCLLYGFDSKIICRVKLSFISKKPVKSKTYFYGSKKVLMAMRFWCFWISRVQLFLNICGLHSDMHPFYSQDFVIPQTFYEGFKSMYFIEITEVLSGV